MTNEVREVVNQACRNLGLSHPAAPTLDEPVTLRTATRCPVLIVFHKLANLSSAVTCGFALPTVVTLCDLVIMRSCARYAEC